MIKKAVNPIYASNFDLEPSKLVSKYIIYSQQRTASTWLCNRLINLKQFGVPAEYLNPRAIQDIIKNENKDGSPINISKYMSLLLAKRTSKEGFFGIKVQPNQLNGIFKKNIKEKLKFIESFDKVIYLKRKDKLNQAISATIALMTDKWWTYDGKIEAIPEEKLNRALMLVAANLHRMVLEDYEAQEILLRTNKPVLTIEYEQIQMKPDQVIDHVAKFLVPNINTEKIKEYQVVSVPVKAERDVPNDLREKFLAFIS